MGATKQAMLEELEAQDRRKSELIKSAEAGNQEAADALWMEFDLIADPTGRWDAEDYTALLRTLSEHEP
jgi:hypothetical protein